VKNLVGTLMLVATALITLGQAQAACPAGLTNPNQLLDSTNWAFLTRDAFDGDIGTFSASATSTNPFAGKLTGFITSNAAEGTGGITIRAALNGGYTVNADCLGGTLLFDVNANSYQFTFVMVNQVGLPPEMYLLATSGAVATFTSGTSTEGPFLGNRGRAVMLAGPPQCPSGASPLSLLVGNWSFLTDDYEDASVGAFNASLTPTSSTTALLNVTQSTSGTGGVNHLGSHIVGEVFNGSFGVYADCSGGSLILPYGNDAAEYEFVFAGPDEIFLVDGSSSFPSIFNTGLLARHGSAVRTQ
jgi:hypothetical protein